MRQNYRPIFKHIFYIYIWLLTATYDIELILKHIQRVKNIIDDIMTRLYSKKVTDIQLLTYLQSNFIREKVSIEDLELDFCI